MIIETLEPLFMFFPNFIDFRLCELRHFSSPPLPICLIDFDFSPTVNFFFLELLILFPNLIRNLIKIEGPILGLTSLLELLALHVVIIYGPKPTLVVLLNLLLGIIGRPIPINVLAPLEIGLEALLALPEYGAIHIVDLIEEGDDILIVVAPPQILNAIKDNYHDYLFGEDAGLLAEHLQTVVDPVQGVLQHSFVFVVGADADHDLGTDLVGADPVEFETGQCAWLL